MPSIQTKRENCNTVFHGEKQLETYEKLKKLYFDNRIEELKKEYKRCGLKYEPLEYLIALKNESAYDKSCHTSRDYNYSFEETCYLKSAVYDPGLYIATSYTKNDAKDKELKDALAKATSYVDDELTREYIHELKAHILDDATVKVFMFHEWFRLHGDPWKSNQIQTWPSCEAVSIKLVSMVKEKYLPSDYKERLEKIYNARMVEAKERIKQQKAGKRPGIFPFQTRK